MKKWPACRRWLERHHGLGRVPAGLFKTLIAAVFRFALLIFCVFAVRAEPPRLELSRSQEGRAVQLRLSGETNAIYTIEVSTNLTSWQILAQLQTTNGTATLFYDASQSHHSFLRARAEETALSVSPQIAPQFGVKAFISNEGGELYLLTPDFRPITLSIPAGCIINPIEVRMSLVTNLVDLPFARGTFGTVQIEPEGLVLLGAAQLSIEYPPGLDSRTVVSFAARNDGTAFGLTVDRVFSNRVVIPVSDFALYGSAVATLDEVETLIPPSARQEPVTAQSVSAMEVQSTPVDICRDIHPEAFVVNQTQFPPSSRECFPFMVNRAIAVQQELRSFLTCDVMDDLAAVLAYNRLGQLLGVPDNSFTIISNAVTRICPIYQEKIEPLWEEAKANCPLSIVLMQFMLGFEQQVQVLGLTNLAACNYTLFGNLDKLCKSAEGCLQQIKGCCQLGKKGQAKYLEIFQIVKQFQTIGDTTCFPLGMDELRVQQALDACLTNAWYGSFQVRRSGGGTTNTVQGDTEQSHSLGTSGQFDGAIFSSSEIRHALSEPATVDMRIIGSGTEKEESTYTQTTSGACLNGNTSVILSRSYRLTTGSLSLTGSETFPKVYLLQIEISPDNTTYTISGGPPLPRGRQLDQLFISRTGCEGETARSYETNEVEIYVDIPGIFVKNRPMGADTNTLQGTDRATSTLQPTDFPVTTDVTWNFKRFRQR